MVGNKIRIYEPIFLETDRLVFVLSSNSLSRADSQARSKSKRET